MTQHKVRLRFKHVGNGVEAHFARNGRFYGICRIAKCDNPNFTAWFIEMLIPGGDLDWLELCNPVSTLREAKTNARKIAEGVIADFQGLELLP